MNILKIFFLVNFLFFYLESFSNYYWQQRVNYNIEIEFFHDTHQFKGKEKLIYYNNSPDTLVKAFFHLYFNAFQPGSMMDVRSRSLPDPDRRVMDRIFNLNDSEIGYHKFEKVKQNNKDVTYHIQGTILEIELADPIYPNDSTIFDLEFYSQVPIQIRRSGRNNKEGIDYSMAQWFPKIAEYDKQGWHAHPYIAREFYSPWGDYNVSISIDQKYVVGATGILKSLKKIGNKSIWDFEAKNVHDFVWAADPDYSHDIVKVPDENIELHFYYQPNSKEMKENWNRLQKESVKAFVFFNKNFGKYPYTKYSIIQAGDGGMEYPMATLITGERSYPSLLSVTVHEALHSWYQMILGTNESYYAWMDEGFTSFAQTITQFELFNDIYKLDSINPLMNSYNRYFNFLEKNIEEPLITHSDHFSTNQAYGVGSYTKGSIFLSQLGYIIGDDILYKGLRRYYNEWKFRHPDKYDFIRVMEKESLLELDWYIDYWIGTTHRIDYSLELIKLDRNSIHLEIHKLEKMPMPIDLEITYADNSKSLIYIPLSIMRGEKSHRDYENIKVMTDWEWVNDIYSLKLDNSKKPIKSIRIDPSMKMADINISNNNLFLK